MSLTVIKSPNSIGARLPENPSVFFGGSIDQGRAIDWQADLAGRIADMSVTVLNPRREKWDAGLEQDISDPVFREQVEWELDALEASDLVIFYFAPGSQSPITLMELGLYAKSGKVVVCCPKGFWRRGNIQIVCRRYDIPLVETLVGLEREIRERIS